MDDPRLKAGKAAMEESRFADALTLLLPLAESGHAEAQEHVGAIFYIGLDNPDLPQAIHWLKKAAAQGQGYAAHNLGTLFLSIQPADPEASARWYLTAYDLGCVLTGENFYQLMRDFQHNHPTS